MKLKKRNEYVVRVALYKRLQILEIIFVWKKLVGTSPPLSFILVYTNDITIIIMCRESKQSCESTILHEYISCKYIQESNKNECK